MIHECDVAVPPHEVVRRAKAFFAERVPAHAAAPEVEGPGFLTLRGQGGEEVVFRVTSLEGGARVRASTLFFDQAVARFISTLPTLAGERTP
jgi:hypothetical protein